MKHCDSCGAWMPDEAVFCTYCGSPLVFRPPGQPSQELYRCYYHPDRFAAYKCSICGKMICKSCRYQYIDRDVCKVCYIKEVIPTMVMDKVRWTVKEPKE